MSKPNNQPPRARASGPDGASIVGDAVLTGVVKTTRGYALATAVVAADGAVKMTLGNSQAFKEFVVADQKRAALAGALKA